MKGLHRFPSRLLAVLLVGLGAGVAQAQLNDTGQQTCYNDSSAADCATVAADAGTHPRQDARFGRDAAAAGVLLKTGGGAAGFDFTPLDADGKEILLTGNPPVPASPPTCIRDNHTNLIWEVKTDDSGLRDKNWTYTWYDSTAANSGTADGTNNCSNPTRCDIEKFAADVNAAGLCGYTTGWRLPTRRQLLSIVHNGKDTAPAIDTSYFPNTVTVSSWYWSADTYAPVSANAWIVKFSDGYTDVYSKSDDGHVRLVRSGT
jgi:hypothetical protein